MKFDRRLFLGSAATSAAAIVPLWRACGQAPAGALTPEQFGARGDGVTNDTDAFARLAAEVNRRGGGEIVLRKATYIVGRQSRGPGGRSGHSFSPAKILEFVGLTKPLVIRGNGARLKCAGGLRYGTFNAASGAATRHKLPHYGLGEVATPYQWMILVENCSGAVEIADLELDGNLPGLTVGGPWGDTGWQIAAVGIRLAGNRGPERIVRVHSHHHGQDGLQIDGVDRSRGSSAASLIEEVRCEYNGRQGVSLVGGRGYAFRACKFNHTGKAVLASAPGAGVDIEAESHKKVRDISFTDCEFSNNVGAGLLADSGDSEGISVSRCTLIGTTSWSTWPNKPRIRFSACTLVGPVARAFGDPDPQRATQFHDCTFRDDPALSPTGEVYGGPNTDRPIADLPDNPNVLFSRCKFLLTHRAVLPWSTNVTYADCVMSQAAPKLSYPRGRYVGRNSITGRAELVGSTIDGELVINGRRVTSGPWR
jgi:hypothetical protein